MSTSDAAIRRPIGATEQSPRPVTQRPGWLPAATLGIFAANLGIAILLAAGQALDFVDRERVLRVFGHERFKVWDGEYWRLATSTFLHANEMHLAFNLAGVLLFGSTVERWLGHARVLAVYSLAAVGGAVFFQAFSGLGVGIGASGGIFGLIGLFLVGRLGSHGGGSVRLGRSFWTGMVVALSLLCLDVVFTDAVVEGASVALSAHLGGLVVGLVSGYIVFTRGVEGRVRRRRATALLAVVLVVVTSYALVFPAFDWSWQLWRSESVFRRGDDGTLEELYAEARRRGGDEAAVKILELEVDRGRLAQALELWYKAPLADPRAHREAGYRFLYGALYKQGPESEANDFILSLARLVDRELEKDRLPELLNEGAWYRALAASELDVALQYVDEALRSARLSSYVNTRGWVKFSMGDHVGGVADLIEAIEIGGLGGECHLYLAIAYYNLGRRQEAAKLAREARRRGLELSHERALLAELEGSL